MSNIDLSKGYIQLISPEGEVLAQRESYVEYVDYHRERVWNVPMGGDVVFVMDSDLIQPNNFKLINDQEAVVDFYDGEDVGIDGNQPEKSKLKKSVKAAELKGNPDYLTLTGLTFWVAFINGEWAGCSEA